jgi:hypothetical protein
LCGLLLLLSTSLDYDRGLEIFVILLHTLDLHRQFEIFTRYYVDSLNQGFFLGVFLLQ